MDNITHSLAGVVLADLASGRRAPKLQRPLLIGVGIIAANLPDGDLVYSSITPAPIGYLLHHRGHTHTLAGLAVLAVALGLVYRSLPSVRRLPAMEQWRLSMLIVAALASHLLLDALNSYGVHPFYPFDSRWFYGDAIFIFEPWIWLVLGVAVAWNARSRTGWLTASVPLIILIATIASMGIVPLVSLAAMTVVGALFVVSARRMTPRWRAGVALALTAAGIGAMFTLSHVAHTRAEAVLRAEARGRLVDLILSPNPASPLCWIVIAVELNEHAGTYGLWRGTLSLAPRVKAPAACASDRLVASGARARTIGGGTLALKDELHLPLTVLRGLARNDCWVRAWLRFARAPVIQRGEVFDLRFADRRNQDFSHMKLDRRPQDPTCPGFVPPWEMPRQDLLGQ